MTELEDYLVLSRDQWLYSNPNGVNEGYYTNFTQDLFFSMQRLSLNPYSLHRIPPSAELPFGLPDDIAVKLSTVTLSYLHQAGRLFVVDYSFLNTIPKVEGKYMTGCIAYFFIHPECNEFLPLAIKTDLGDGLVYTPLDSENDWFLAKTLFESNDNFFSAAYHLASTHAPAEIIHSAAVRSLASRHPIRGLLDRSESSVSLPELHSPTNNIAVMFRAYAIRTAGARALFNVGGRFDQSFALGSPGFSIYSSMLYHTEAGHVQSNYFDRFFVSRGLVNCTYGPELPHFPFYEDVAPLVAVLTEFMTTYVTQYYPSDEVLAADDEIQAWALEASGPARIYDFPAAPITSRGTLIKLLAHVAYLAGIEHHAINTNSLAASRPLPLHPTSHWAPLPTEKGVQSVLPYLPNLNQSIAQMIVENQFSRPNLMYENGTLINAFSDPAFLAATTPGVQSAAVRFLQSMATLGVKIDSKRFDDQGLCQGMPFIWRDVNPVRIPFFLAI